MNFKIKKIYIPIVFILITGISNASDKNGVSPNTISLPSGPGSIEGLGDSFQPMLNTGTSKYSVKIIVPKGINNLEPELSLHYDSGLGDGCIGLGWTFGFGAIKRQVDKGIPRYIDFNNRIDDDNDGIIDNYEEIDQILGPDGEELIQINNNIFRARIESTFTRYRRMNDYWEADLRNGSRLIFGKNPKNRITDATGSKIYQWLLEKHIDVNGNTIEYYYSSFNGSDNQKYLSEIRYAPGAPPWKSFYFVYFEYESRPDWRKDYRSGFVIKTTMRLCKINIGLQDNTISSDLSQNDSNIDGTSDSLIRQYRLTYGDAESENHFLKTVTHYDSKAENYLPPISFEYYCYKPSVIISAKEALSTSINTPNTVMDNPHVEFVDMNRDSMPDILLTEQYGNNHKVYLNLGEQGDTKQITWDRPRNVVSSDGLANNFWLENDQVFLSDMDGDGLSDLTFMSLNEVFFFPNNANNGWLNRKKMVCADSIQGVMPPSPFGNPNVRSSDFDFNKHMDIIRSSDTGYATWLNLGKGKYSRKINTSGALYMDNVIRFDLPNSQMADINGDRLNDIVLIKDSRIIYCANMGYGYFDKAISISLKDFFVDNQRITFKNIKTSDINNDGLSDLIAYHIPGNQLWYWINYGNDSFSEKHIINDLPANYSLNSTIRWVDINGNGSIDLVFADSNAEQRLKIIDIARLTGGSNFINLLHKINNGHGVITTIYYQSSTNQLLKARSEGKEWDNTLPFPVTVVSKIETTTGLDLDDISGKDRYTKEYTYKNGYYEFIEKSFRGYEFTEVFVKGDSTYPGTITRHNFYTGAPDSVDNDQGNQIDEVINEKYREEDALKGMVKKVEVLSSDHLCLYSVNENLWKIKTLYQNSENIEIRFPFISQRNKKIYDATDIPEILTVHYEYDDYGNKIKVDNQGSASIKGDEVITINSFINDHENWILGKQYSQVTTDISGNKYAEIKSYYDGEPYIGLIYGKLTNGNLTRKQGWVKDDHYVDIVRHAFDKYGKVIGIMDANGSKRSIEYDDHLGIFPVKERIHLDKSNPESDLVITVDYNYDFGVVTKSIDFNGYETHYTYDSFGRLVHLIKPGDSIEYPSQTYSYEIGDPEREIVYSYDSFGKLTIIKKANALSAITTRLCEKIGQQSTFDSIQYIDGLGRKLAFLSEGEDGFIVKESIMLNSRGKEHYSFLPYKVNSSDYPPLSLNRLKTELFYDALGRTIRIKNPPNQDNQITEKKTQYIHLKTIITDENNNSKSQIYDGLERLIEVHEHNNNEIYITYYQYDPLGNLIKIIDAQNNIQTMIYDGLNRKVQLNDPDRGKMINKYDDVGNLIKRIDNKGQQILYTYDSANRILTEDYMDENKISPDVRYYYDTPSKDYPDLQNLKGQLSWIKDLSGAHFFSYDKRGKINTSIKRITDNEKSIDYKTSSLFDAMGRITLQQFPDNDQFQYLYNNASLLESIPGIVNDINYNASGQMDSIEYYNGIITHYSYDTRNRIKKCITKSTNNEQKIIQDLSYIMDGVGNITQITDNRVSLNNIKQNATQLFQYDDLYRLTCAESPGYGLINYRYDKIGNMIFKKSTDKSNAKHINDVLINLGVMNNGGNAGTSNRSCRKPDDPPGPHAITATESALKYDYDANGNMISRNGDQYEWNYLDRLISIKKDNKKIRHVYDYIGQRIIKKIVNEHNVTKTTYYINKQYEVREGKSFKYVYLGNRKISQIKGSLSETIDNNTQTLILKPGWNFISFDIEPESPFVDKVLLKIKNNLKSIWYYDAVKQEFIGYEPEKEIYDLTELHANTAYVIDMLSGASLLIYGSRVSKNTLNLVKGWNLLPCPTNMIQSINDSLMSIHGKYDSIWSYNSVTCSWNIYFSSKPNFTFKLDQLTPGKSYWIKMRAEVELEPVEKTNQVFFYHPDHLGSTNAVTNMKGEVVESIEYYPYGRPRFEEREGFKSDYKYIGKELDEESGLMYYEARYYDSVTGKFINVDPILHTLNLINKKQLLNKPKNLNSYSYSYNSPLRFIDITGKHPIDLILSIFSYTKEALIQPFKGYGVLKGKKPYIEVKIDPPNILDTINNILDSIDKIGNDIVISKTLKPFKIAHRFYQMYSFANDVQDIDNAINNPSFSLGQLKRTIDRLKIEREYLTSRIFDYATTLKNLNIDQFDNQKDFTKFEIDMIDKIYNLKQEIKSITYKSDLIYKYSKKEFGVELKVDF